MEHPKTNDKGQSLQLIENKDGEQVMCKQIREGTWASVETSRIVRNYNPPFAGEEGRILASEARQKGLQNAKDARRDGILAAVRNAGYDAKDIFDVDGYVHEILASEVVLNMEVPAGFDKLWKSAGLVDTKNPDGGITIHALELLVVGSMYPGNEVLQLEKLKEIRGDG